MDYTIVLAIASVFMILLSVPSSVLYMQNASALASVVQITSAKADSSNLINGGFANIAQGKTTVKVTFDYRGFDDNDHVLELRCSWDGVNYLKSNCSTESAESRTTFTGPDGVARAYYVKTGTASRDLAAPPVPKTYTFGVKVLNDNGNLGPATAWTFKIRSSTTPPVGGTEEGTGGVEPENNMKKIKVTFNSITVHDDHRIDPTVPTPGFRGTPGFPATTVLSGEWILYAYVQGQFVSLLDNKEVLSGKTYQFQGKEVTVDIKSHLPLSIFTKGIQRHDYFPFTGLCVLGRWESEAKEIFTFPVELWKQKINEYRKINDCSEDDQTLGLINDFILPPDYKSWLTPEQIANFPTGPFMKYALDFATGPDFVKTSSTKDFTLRYTLQIDRDHRD